MICQLIISVSTRVVVVLENVSLTDFVVKVTRRYDVATCSS